MTHNDYATSTDGVEETIIEQDHKRGPGWFLLTSYVVISVFCVYYLFTNWNWQSDYDRQQAQSAQVQGHS